MTSEKSATGQLILSMLIFGTVGIFVRFIPLPSGLIAMVRGFVGAGFLLLIMRFRRQRLDRTAIRRNLLRLCLSGACIGMNWILLFEAYRHTTVAVATLCYYLAPVFVMLSSPLVLKEKLTWQKCACAAVALIGMTLVTGVFGGTGGFDTAGVLCGVGAAVLYACVVLMNKRLSPMPAMDCTVVQLGAATAVLVPYTLLTQSYAGLSCPPLGLVLLAAVGVVHTGLAYALYFGSMQRLSAQTVALLSYLDPVVAILAATLILGERMGLWGAVGAALVLGATLAGELVGLRMQHGKQSRDSAPSDAVEYRREV